MHPVSSRRRGHAGGFTLVEIMVVVAIIAALMGFGIPAMSGWMMANKAAAASEFYLEGFRAARLQAISHNAPSRIVLSANQTTGQMDWQVDICFPTAAAPCTALSANWSTTTTPAAGDPDPSSKFTSIKRTADVLASSTLLAVTKLPADAYAVYYTSLGWVDTSIANRLARLQLDPLPAYAAQLPTTAIAITLAGMPVRCNADAAVTDSRGCPP